ncbi:MAG: DUF1565 domain-containing protein [candidate division Zixibacteria bacterium]|nr:DUF1565 domain-containing protein [candidate division Zixibacteria bacterium]
MKRIFLIPSLFICVSFFANNALALPGDTIWSRYIGGTSDDYANCLLQLDDEGFLTAGITGSYGAGAADWYVIKTDSLGDTLWTKTYGGSENDILTSSTLSHNGGIILAGNTSSFGSGIKDIYLVNIDDSGDTLWTKTYGGGMLNTANEVIRTIDGGYALAGYTSGFGLNSSMLLIKTDSDGDSLWSMIYNFGSSDNAQALLQTDDGGFLIGGWSETGDADICIVRTDSLGDTLWSKMYGGEGAEQAYDILRTGSGEFIVAGTIRNYGAVNADIYIMKLDAGGDSLWSRRYGGTYNDESRSVIGINDSTYAIGAFTDATGDGKADIYLLKIDSQGDTIHTYTYGGGEDDRAYSIVKASNGDLVLAGHTESYGAGLRDIYLLRVSDNSPPLISSIQMIPDEPGPYEEFDISAIITDTDDSVAGADLYYNNSDGYVSLAMTSVDDSFYVTLPSQQPGSSFDYYISAMDVYGDSTVSDTLSYTFPLPSTVVVPDDFATIQEAIDSSSSGDTILVNPGEYIENIDYSGKNLIIASLFLTTGEIAYIDSTIIDGDSAGCVIKIENGEDSTAVLAGFTVRNGYADSGGGIYCRESSPVIYRNKIMENLSMYGAGIYIDSLASPAIRHNLIYENYADSSGAGIFARHDSSEISNNTIVQNIADSSGGGIHCDSCASSLINTIIWDNQADTGGQVSDYHETSLITYSDIQDTLWPGEGNISDDPKFIDPLMDNYNIAASSPCIDSGDPDWQTDPDGSRADIGVYFEEHPQYVNRSKWFVSINGDDSTGDGSEELPFRSIQFAVDISDNDDTIQVDAGIFEEKLIISHALFLMATSGPDSTTIDGGDTIDDSASSVITITDADSVFIKGFSITGGRGLMTPDSNMVRGGGIAVINTATSIDTCMVFNNGFDIPSKEVIGGGGIYADSASSLSISASFIYSNIMKELYEGENFPGAMVGGGGVLALCDSVFIENSEIYGNYALSEYNPVAGGGIYLEGSHNQITGCRIDSNTVNGTNYGSNSEDAKSGGGLFIKGDFNTLRNTSISCNTAGWWAGYFPQPLTGGGVYSSGDSLNINNCRITGNRCETNLFPISGSILYDINSDVYGGGAYIDGSDIAIDSSMISRNYIFYYYETPGSPIIISGGGGLYLTGSGRISYNLFEANACTTITSGYDATVLAEGGGSILRGDIDIINNTFWGNNIYVEASWEPDGVGDINIYAGGLDADEQCLFKNNIMTGSQINWVIPDYGTVDYTGGGLRIPLSDSVQYCDIWNNYPTNVNEAIFPEIETTFSTNPRFVDIENSDFRLTANSPCRYAGEDSVDIGYITGGYGDSVFLELSVDSAYADSFQAGTEEYPYSSIQLAINNALNGDTVVVANGTYFENIDFIGKAILLTSEYLNSADTSDIYATIIDGDSLGSVVTFRSGEDTSSVLNGFTIENGLDINGGGVQCVESNPKLTFNIIKNNSAGNGGGFFCGQSNPILYYNLFYDNSADSGGAASFISSNPRLINNTIAVNTGDSSGGAIYMGGNSLLDMKNSILWQNSSYDSTQVYIESGTLDITYSVIEDTLISGEGNGQYDPRFIDIDARNFNFLFNSPCIDSGDPDSLYLDPDSTLNDMGFYYYDQTLSPELQFDSTLFNIIIQSGTVDTQSVILNNPGSGTLEFYAWGEVDTLPLPFGGNSDYAPPKSTGGGWVSANEYHIETGIQNYQKLIQATQPDQKPMLNKSIAKSEKLEGMVINGGTRISNSSIINLDINPYLIGTTGRVDPYGYSTRVSGDTLGPEFSWIDITSTGIRVDSIGNDEPVGPYDTGFDFPFYNLSYSRFWISPNGHIAFFEPAKNNNNTELPSFTASIASINPFWDDLDPSQGGEIYFYTNENDSLIVSFIDVRSAGGADDYTFQAIIASNGDIVFNYLDMNGDVESATGGIQNMLRNAGFTVFYDEPFIEDSMAVDFDYSWASPGEGSGSIDPEDNLQFDIQISALGISEGSYSAKIKILNNDPGQTEVELPVTIDVTPGDEALPTELISPPDGAYSNRSNIILHWAKTSGQFDSYIVEGAFDPQFNTKSTINFIPDTTFFIPSSFLENRPYFWRVTTVNHLGEESVFSDTFLFWRNTNLPDLSITMIPNNNPITIPGQGGNFSYTGILRSNVDAQRQIDVWLMILYPDSSQQGPYMHIDNFSFDAYNEKTYYNIVQYIPGSFPTGEYLYQAYVGNYPNLKTDSSSFPFSKSANVSKDPGLRWITFAEVEGWFDDAWLGLIGSQPPEADIALPAKYTLSQNYPNPFNSSTVIEYALPEAGPVELSLYNLQGQKVATLIDTYQAPGWEKIVWDASNLSSGIYFYKITAGDYSAIKRMTLLK